MQYASQEHPTITKPEVPIMLSEEMLAWLGTGAVFPYAAEALWSWARTKRKHRNGARTHCR
ncbi:MAG: hypothetical protein CVU34_15065 [Betaproteobacteria bacterium HGW-Betaproteobacteria-7]|jgi:hypothetical protein|nr:MAG: hypothetical protein CVU34_15065 [Betaproteobacteria bacterium HGW-Betaproteobacteria-7]